MFNPRTLKFIFLLLIPVLIIGLWAVTAYYQDLPSHISQHETIILGQNRYTPGSQAALRVVVRDSKDGSPLANSKIDVYLQPATGGKRLLMYSGVTDPRGGTNVSFRVPEDAAVDQTLIVETRSNLGSDIVERPVTITRDYRLLITSDKPIYQPGQVIHLRALALSAFDLIPAQGQEVEFVIADGKGNKVFRKTLTTSDFGVVSTDFQLANEVNTGAYKITANMGNTSSEKTITVEHYVLPKYALKLETERAFYLPGEQVKGTLRANYFFGKPVAEGDVKLEGYTFDVQQNVVVSLTGTTDERGDFEFVFDLPSYIAGSDLESGLGRFYMQAIVTDQAQHSEVSTLSIPVSASALVIEAIPEGGQFRPGVENILYVLTSYPDGTPAEADLRLTFYQDNRTIEAQTGTYGLAEIRLTPSGYYQEFLIEAQDQRGNTAQQQFFFEGEYSEESVLLRPDKPVYRVGDSMRLNLLTSQPKGTVYLDIVREGQTVSTRSVEISDGKAEVVVDLTPDLYGTLELHAYKILRSGTITRDTRLVVVDQAEDLNIQFAPDQEVYRPGDQVNLNIQVNDQDGKGSQAALGLAIVDESVFALAEQDPGFAKLYFMLEQELLQPRYDLHGFSVPDLVRGVPISSQPTLEAIEDAAQASLADVAAKAFRPSNSAFSLTANSHQEAMQRAAELQQKYFTGLSTMLFITFLCLPLIVMGLVVSDLWRQKRLGRSLVTVLLVLSLLTILMLTWPLGENYSWADSLIDRMGIFMDWLNQGDMEVILLCLVLAGPLGFLTLAVLAWRRKDRILGWMLGLLMLFIGVLFILIKTATLANQSPDTGIALVGVFIPLLIPLAFLLTSADHTWERQNLTALAALALGIFLLIIPFLTLSQWSSAQPKLAGLGRKGMVVEEAFGIPAPVEMPVATQAAVAVVEDEVREKAGSSGEEGASAAEPPRLRQYFPETMLWLPDEVTDPDGSLSLEFPVADSITTWRITALASSQDGHLGSTTAGLRVFQDFFIDLDLPVALTVDDEVSIPVGVFNYLTEAQSVRLELEQAEWFELLDEPVKEIDIAANDISVVYFRVKAVQFGRQPFKVTAWGSKMSDAIQKEVRVFPNGKQITFSHSDRLTAGEPIQQTVNIPTDIIAGTQTLTVKVYPGILSQVVEGLDSILRMPFGCFEQTSSTTYPNVLVLDYLKSTNQASPETQMKAEEYINLGYQRLLTFEVQGSGGFSLFGDAPADRMLTAYGLQEFADMSRVYEVDPELIQRAADWLLSQQNGDGSWENDRGLVHENTWAGLGNDRLPVTAYIAWSLIEAGFIDQSGTQNGISYVRERQAETKDAYVLALVANALVASDLESGGEITQATQAVLDRLADMAITEGNKVYWKSGVATFMGSEGQTGSIETTALAALAFLRSDTHPELGNAALTSLVQQKDNFGTWYSTQATVLALKALIQSVHAGAEKVNATITLSLNGGQTRTVQVARENFDVVQLVSFDDVNPGGENLVKLDVEGEGNLMYQITGGYYLPWDKLASYPELIEQKELVTIEVQYDRTELAVNDTVGVHVTIQLNQVDGKAESALIDLGVPPGFTVQTEDLAALVARFNDTPEDYAFPKIERFELTGRQILIYLSNLSYGNPLEFSYQLLAKFPLVAQTPASNAYDYYNPEVSGEARPMLLTVNP